MNGMDAVTLFQAALTGGIIMYMVNKLTKRGKKDTIAVWDKPYKKKNTDEEFSFILYAVGTRGDVQPMIALACELKKRAKVTICAAEQFRSLVTSFGLEFESCGLESLAEQEAGWLKAQTESEFLSSVAGTYLPQYVKMGTALYNICQKSKPTCILTGVYGLHIALDVAEKCQIKVRCIKYMPEGISRYHAPFGSGPVLFNHPYWILFLHIIRLVRMVIAARRYGFTKVQNEFRTRVLGIGPITAERLESGGKYLPTAFAYSQSLAVRPRDWAEWHQTFGFLFVPTDPKTRLSANIDTFLASGSAPIAITFGSMNSLSSAGCDVVKRSCDACISLGLRVILISGWTKVDLQELELHKNVLVVNEAPHELLFPKCQLVIHHGGAGTTARVAQAGVPSIVIPILRWLDQQGWGMAVAQFGSGIHIKSPFAEEGEIKQAVEEILLHPVRNLVFKARAKDLARRIESDGNAAEHIANWLMTPLSPVSYDTRYYQAKAIERMVQRSCLYDLN